MDFNNQIKKYAFVDLFAGIGGVRIGFENAGFNCVFSNDFDANCKKTYDLNFSKELCLKDIRELSVNDIPDFNILLGGFPCQPFSIAGYRQGFNDEKERGNLFFEIIRILKIKKPNVILLENVKNLSTHDKGNTMKIILSSLSEIGYSIKYKVLNTAKYGNLPQNRERVYIVGFLDENISKLFEFPEELDLTTKISDCLENKEVNEIYYYNNKNLFPKLKDLVTQKNTVYQWRRKYVRENKSNLSPTLTANMGTGGHNVPIICDDYGIRKLTPRECANLQGFPKEFILPKIADSQLYKQFGNSVSIPVIQRLANIIKKLLE